EEWLEMQDLRRIGRDFEKQRSRPVIKRRFCPRIAAHPSSILEGGLLFTQRFLHTTSACSYIHKRKGRLLTPINCAATPPRKLSSQSQAVLAGGFRLRPPLFRSFADSFFRCGRKMAAAPPAICCRR